MNEKFTNLLNQARCFQYATPLTLLKAFIPCISYENKLLLLSKILNHFKTFSFFHVDFSSMATCLVHFLKPPDRQQFLISLSQYINKVANPLEIIFAIIKAISQHQDIQVALPNSIIKHQQEQQ